jgi:hypothetical protein
MNDYDAIARRLMEDHITTENSRWFSPEAFERAISAALQKAFQDGQRSVPAVPGIDFAAETGPLGMTVNDLCPEPFCTLRKGHAGRHGVAVDQTSMFKG